MPSPQRLRSLPLTDIRITDPCWSRYQSAVPEQGLLAQYGQLATTDRLKNFQRVAKGDTGGLDGSWFSESDVYKWIEGAAYALVHGDTPELKKSMDEAIDIVAKAQEPNGYVNTFFQLMHPNLKWRNLHTMHEMYCAGHLIE